jgi:hypothetical protein
MNKICQCSDTQMLMFYPSSAQLPEEENERTEEERREEE